MQHYHYFTLEQRAVLEKLVRARMPSESTQSIALSRLQEPDYGICIECGKDIAFAQLELDPAALHCRDCASLPVRKAPAP